MAINFKALPNQPEQTASKESEEENKSAFSIDVNSLPDKPGAEQQAAPGVAPEGTAVQQEPVKAQSSKGFLDSAYDIAKKFGTQGVAGVVADSAALKTYAKEQQPAMKLLATAPDVALGFRKEATPDEIAKTDMSWYELLKSDRPEKYMEFEKSPTNAEWYAKFADEAALNFGDDLLEYGTRPGTVLMTYLAYEKAFPLLAKKGLQSLAQKSPKAYEFLTKNREVPLLKEAKKAINEQAQFLKYRVKKIMGIKQETGMTLYDINRAIKEGRIGEAEALRRSPRAFETRRQAEVTAAQGAARKAEPVVGAQEIAPQAGAQIIPEAVAPEIVTPGVKPAVIAADAIPVFKNTTEAMDYGKSVKGNNEVIEALRKKRTDSYMELDAIKKQPKTQEMMQAFINKATESQLYREALQEAGIPQSEIIGTKDYNAIQERKAAKVKEVPAEAKQEAVLPETPESAIKDPANLPLEAKTKITPAVKQAHIKKYAEMLNHPPSKFHEKFVDAVINKEAGPTLNMITSAKGQNEVSKKMFTEITGVKLPGTAERNKEVVNAWISGEKIPDYQKFKSRIGEKLKANTGEPIKIEGYDAYVAKAARNKFAVYEKTTGMQMSNQHGSKAEAVEFATNRIQQIGKEKVETAISNVIKKYGEIKGQTAGKVIKTPKPVKKAVKKATSKPKPTKSATKTDKATKEAQVPEKAAKTAKPAKKGSGKGAASIAPGKASKGGRFQVAEPGTQEASYAIKKEYPEIDMVRKIETPELVQLAEQLSPSGRPTLKKFPKASGMFYSAGGSIKLHQDIFKKPEAAAAVLAHEIGHLFDWMPDKMMKRGNVTGRLISSVSKFMKTTFKKGAGAMDLNQLRKTALKDFRAQHEVTMKDISKNDVLKKEWSEYWKGYKENALKKGGYIKNETVSNELKALSQKWHPFDTAVDPGYTAYRYSAVELYADFMSVVLNSPKTALEIAPTAYNMFFEFLDQKPAVKNDYFELQALLSGDKARIYQTRENRVNQMFDKGEQEARAIKMRGEEAKHTIRDMLSQWFIDNNHFILKGRTKVAKTQTINPEDDPKYLLEESNFIGSVVKAYLEDLQPAYLEMINKGIENEVDQVLFFERISEGDRQEMANSLGFSPQTSKDQLKFLKEKDPQKYKDAKNVVEKYRDWFSDLNDKLKEDILSPSQIELVSGNDKYAPFRVIKHMKDYVSAGIAPQGGTLSDITSLHTAMTLKGVSMVRAYERNKIIKKVGGFIEKNAEAFGNVEPAKIVSYPGVFSVKPHKDSFMKPIIWREKGKWKGLYVDKYIAQSINTGDTGLVATVGDIVGSMLLNNSVFRPLYITFNVGFQSTNLIRDFMRYWKNVPGMTMFKAMRSYAKAVPSAVKRVKGEFDKTINEMEKEKALTVTFNDFLKGESTEDKEIASLLKAFDLLKGGKKKGFNPIMSMFDAIKDLGDIIETIPKVAGYNELVNLPQKERTYNVRNFVGTPNFKRGGTLKPIYNNVWMFSNIIKEAIRGTYEVAFTNPRTRGGWWWKTAQANIMPKLMMYLAGAGAFGAWMKKAMDDATEYDKTNYTIVPLGEYNGKTMYFRLPQDEEGRIMGGLAWKLLNVKDNNLENSMQELLSFTGEQIPFAGKAPLIEISKVWSDFMTGRAPRDEYRGDDLLSRKEVEAGGIDALVPMIKWTLNQSGHLRFDVHDRYRDQTLLEQAVQITPIVNRFIRISNYGTAQDLYQELDKERKTAAKASLKKDRLMKDVLKGRITVQDATEQLPRKKRKAFEKKVSKKKYLEATDDPVGKVLKSAQSNAQKMVIIKKSIKKGYLKKETVEEYLTGLAKANVISKRFRGYAMSELMKEGIVTRSSRNK